MAQGTSRGDSCCFSRSLRDAEIRLWSQSLFLHFISTTFGLNAIFTTYYINLWINYICLESHGLSETTKTNVACTRQKHKESWEMFQADITNIFKEVNLRKKKRKSEQHLIHWTDTLSITRCCWDLQLCAQLSLNKALKPLQKPNENYQNGPMQSPLHSPGTVCNGGDWNQSRVEEQKKHERHNLHVFIIRAETIH